MNLTQLKASPWVRDNNKYVDSYLKSKNFGTPFSGLALRFLFLIAMMAYGMNLTGQALVSQNYKRAGDGGGDHAA